MRCPTGKHQPEPGKGVCMLGVGAFDALPTPVRLSEPAKVPLLRIPVFVTVPAHDPWFEKDMLKIEAQDKQGSMEFGGTEHTVPSIVHIHGVHVQHSDSDD